MKKTSTLIFTVIAIVLVSFGVVLLFHHHLSGPTAKDNLLVETSKAIMQLVFVVALGGLLKLLYDQVAEQYQLIQKEKEEARVRQETANTVRTNILSDLIAARTTIEKVRLQFGIEESEEPLKQYKSTILSILEARVNLARLWNAVITASYLFANDGRIAQQILQMKHYLDKLINEYNEQIVRLRGVAAQDQVAAIHALPEFGDFLKNEEKTKYAEEFLNSAYRLAVKEIRIEVLRASRVRDEDLEQAQNEPIVSTLVEVAD